MSQSLKQSMTNKRLRLLGQEFDALKRQLNIVASAPAQTPGYQMIGGTPIFTGGFGIGGHSIYEPTVIPAATGLSATWSASFDTIGIDLSWTAPAGVGADQIASYVIQVQKHGSSSPPIEVSVSASRTSTRVEPVEPNTTYDISVSAMAKLGRLAAPATTTLTTGGDTTPPSAPTFPGSPVLVAINGLSVKWNANTERDVANGAGQYRVVVSTSSSLTSPVFDAKTNGTNLFINPLTAGTAYYVGVYAIDSSGNSSSAAQPSGGPWTPAFNVTDSSALAIGGGNVVLDASFEYTGSPVAGQGWDRYTSSAFDTSTFRYGKQSLTFSGSGDLYWGQDITIGAGTWMLSTWTKAASVGVASGSPAGVVLSVVPTSGTLANHSVMMNGTLNIAGGGRVDAIVGAGTWDWKRTAIKFDVTSASAVVRVIVQRGYGGSSSGQAWFDGAQLENGATITAFAPRPDEILPSSIGTTQIADDSISTAKLIAASITAAKIAAGTIGATQIAAHSILAGNIAADTLTASEIAAGAITANELAANSVTAAAILANTITATQIAANTITASNLSVTLGLSVGQYIQSSNFVSSTSGWRIDGAGNAELNSADIRGTLHAAQFGGSPFEFVSSDGHNGLRVIAAAGDVRLQLGDQQNISSYIGWNPSLARIDFEAGPAPNSPAWRFGGDVQYAGVAIHETEFEFWQGGIQVATHRSVSGVNETRFPLVPAIAGNTAIINTTSWQLGYTTSSKRFKHGVTDLDSMLSGADNPIFKARPRHFYWNDDVVARSGPGADRLQTGLIAEEVAAVMPTGVHIDEDGQPRSLNETTLIGYLIDAVHYLKERTDELAAQGV